MPEMEHAFVARFGNKVVKGHTFTAVGDVLAEHGYDMAAARRVEPRVVEIPHKDGQPVARLEAKPPPEPEPPPTSVDVAAAAMAGEAVVAGARAPVGLYLRECGAMHSEGVFCLIVVYVMPRQCDCGDIVYEHQGPHEAVGAGGVQYRWEEILLIQDCAYNGYGPIKEDDDA